MAENATKVADCVVCFDRDDMLVMSMKRHDLEVFEFTLNSGDTVWVIAKTLHRAQLGLAQNMATASRKVTKTDLSVMCREALMRRIRDEEGE